MDWATILREYPAAVTAVAGLIGIILTFVFTRWNAERNRKWEREDKDLNRRIEDKKRKLEDAHVYVDSLFEAGRKLVHYQYTIIKHNEVEKYEADYRSIGELFESSANKAISISLLNDKDLSTLHRDFLYALQDEFKFVETLEESIKKGEELDKEGLIQRLRGFNNKVADAMREIYKRLDVISNTILTKH